MLQNNTFSLFRKLETSCLHTLSFISLVILTLFISTTNVYSAQVMFGWNQNTESDLAGYKIYIGPSSGNYNNVNDVGNQTNYTIQNLILGQTYYVAVTAYDALNNESSYSAESVYTVPIPNTNNAPALDPITDITVNEGDVVALSPTAT
ncbi:MAG: fibronectin type III domain-containing protein, partial [Planctomycetota bacterium]